MLFRRTVAALYRRAGPISLAYHRRVKSGFFSRDMAQLQLVAELDSLHSSLASPGERWLIPDRHMEEVARYYGGSSSPSIASLAGIAMASARSIVGTSPRGIYIHGSVGVGKSALMDLFYSICDAGFVDGGFEFEPIRRKRRRCHFHEFMLDVHMRIHAYKAIHPQSDPIPPVAAALAKEARLLCFDEMQITDIADAMIMKRLLTILIALGVVIVTTSNRPPCGLYEGGINRSIFVPFIDTLKERMTIIEMGGTHDYRRDVLASHSETFLPAYICSSENHPAQETLDLWFARGGGATRKRTISVAMGRCVHVERANDACAWFGFDELCKRPLGAADYIAIAGHFDTVIVDGVPQLCGNAYNEARRFVTLVDALYEAQTKFVISAEVPRDDLFVGFVVAAVTNDGDEEIAIEGNPGNSEEILIVGEGGSSSSSSTTMVQSREGYLTEWSATGRIGVSLAQLSSVREVSFSFERAQSRLAEMSAETWGKGGSVQLSK